jgi:RHS repeat-associated protein
MIKKETFNIDFEYLQPLKINTFKTTYTYDQIKVLTEGIVSVYQWKSLKSYFDEFESDLQSYSDYYPFGMQMPGRNGGNNDYRYGYQGSESDNEVKGQSNSYTTHFRQLDPRLGRWLTIDPKATPFESPYTSMANNPILNNDVLGDTIRMSEAFKASNKYQSYQLFTKTRAGKNFVKRYSAGGSHGDVLVELATFDDKSNFKREDGSEYKSKFSGPQTVSGSYGETASFTVDRKTKEITHSKGQFQIASIKKRRDYNGRKLTSMMKGDHVVQLRFTNESDIRDGGLTILHEVQHLRIYDYQKRMFGRIVVENQHSLMRENLNPGFGYKDKGYKIYDFRAERWGYLKDTAPKGETDFDRDIKSNEFGN